VTATATPVRRTQARRTQAQRRAASDRRLLEATAELIVERGIEGTSLAEIGRRAGYSHALVNHRFGSKDALIQRLNEAAIDLFTEAMATAIDTRNGVEAVRIIAETYLDMVRPDSAIGRVHLVVWSESLAHGSPRRPYRVTWDRYFREAIAGFLREGRREGTIRKDIDVDASAMIIVGLLRGVALQAMLDPVGAPLPSRTVLRDHVTRMLSP
jgi:AcrR family transcriptional regulator